MFELSLFMVQVVYHMYCGKKLAAYVFFYSEREFAS